MPRFLNRGGGGQDQLGDPLKQQDGLTGGENGGGLGGGPVEGLGMFSSGHTLAPMNTEEDRANDLILTIGKIESKFDKESKEKGTSENVWEHTQRVRRNQELKKNYEQMPGFSAKDKKEAYLEDKERHPDEQRRIDNAKLKEKLYEQSHEMFPEHEDVEARKAWRERQYLEQREHFGGEKAKKKTELFLRKQDLKEKAKSIFGVKKGDEDEKLAKVWVKRQMAKNEEDPEARAKLERKSNKFETEQMKIYEKKDPKKHNERVQRNKSMKQKLGEMISEKDPKLRELYIESNYSLVKEYSGGETEKQQRQTKAKTKLQQTLDKKKAKEENSELKAQLKETMPEDKALREKTYAMMMVARDKETRKEKNKLLRKHFSREEYRQLKVHEPKQEGGGGDDEEKDKLGEVLDVVKPLTTVAGLGNKAVGKGYKLDTILAGKNEDGGNVRPNTEVLGTSTEVNRTPDPFDKEIKVKTGGTTNQATAIIESIGGGVNLVANINSVGQAVSARDSDDPAVREKAKTEIVDGVSGIADSTLTLGSGILKAIQFFSGPGAQLAETMKLTVLPIVGLAKSIKTMFESAYQMGLAAGRAKSAKQLGGFAKENEDVALQSSLKSLENADLRLVASSIAEMVQASIAIAGDALTLAAVPVGPSLKIGASVFGVARKAASTIAESARAGTRKKNIIKYHDSLNNEDKDTSHIIKRARKLLESDEKYAVQAIIDRAREGDPIAIDYLSLFQLDAKDFETMDDKTARKHILSSIQTSQEPETLLDKLRNIPNQLRDAKRKLWRGKIKKSGY